MRKLKRTANWPNNIRYWSLGREINLTPVIARALYRSGASNTVDENLNSIQFAYRDGGNCTDALLTIQQQLCNYLDNPKCKAVKLFAVHFSKHDLLATQRSATEPLHQLVPRFS